MDPMQPDSMTQPPEMESQEETLNISETPLEMSEVAQDQPNLVPAQPDQESQAPDRMDLSRLTPSDLASGPIPIYDLGEELPGIPVDVPSQDKQDMIDRWEERGLEQKPDWYQGRLVEFQEDLKELLRDQHRPIRIERSLDFSTTKNLQADLPQIVRNGSKKIEQLRLWEAILHMWEEASTSTTSMDTAPTLPPL